MFSRDVRRLAALTLAVAATLTAATLSAAEDEAHAEEDAVTEKAAASNSADQPTRREDAVQDKADAGTATREPVTETLPEGCVRHVFTVPSPSMQRDIRVAVVVPPAYAAEPERCFPVLYALHGMGAPYLAFTEMTPLRRFMVEHPMILVVFDGDKDGCYVDATARPQSLFTTFFFDELIPFIGKHYRTTGERAVTGFSMGGYGALHYLLARPEMFASASGLSSAPFLFHPERDAEKHLGGNALLGPRRDNQEAYAAASVPDRLRAFVNTGTKLPPILLMCGTEDFLRQRNRKLVDLFSELNRGILAAAREELAAIEDKAARRQRAAEIMAKRSIDFRYVETPGAHNWVYWRDTSPEIAEFHWQHFNK